MATSDSLAETAKFRQLMRRFPTVPRAAKLVYPTIGDSTNVAGAFFCERIGLLNRSH